MAPVPPSSVIRMITRMIPAMSGVATRGSARCISQRQPERTPVSGSSPARMSRLLPTSTATTVTPSYRLAHDPDGHVVEHAAVDEEVAVGGAHRREDARDREAGAQPEPRGAGAVDHDLAHA